MLPIATSRRMLILAAFLIVAATAGVARAVPTITVAPGASPGGYLPLSLFGVTPVAGVTDDGVVNFNVPGFRYAGEAWTSVGFASNGFLILGGGADGTAVNQSLPNASGPNNILAPFWTDLDPTAAGALRVAALTDGVNTWIVFDWNGVPEANDGTITNFEVWIGIDGTEDITYAYDFQSGVGNGDGGLLTIGAEDKTGTVGANFHFNGSGPLPTTDLRVTTRDLPVPEPSTLLLLGVAASVLALRRNRGRIALQRG